MLEECLKEHEVVSWRIGKRKFEVGDVVYIYAVAPVRRITHELRVSRIDLDKPTYDESPFRGEKWTPYEVKHDNRAEFQLVRRLPETKFLTYDELSKHGLIGRIQGPITVSGQLLEHIQTSIAEIETHKSEQHYWIVPVDTNRFRIHDYLQNYNQLEWTMNRNFGEGDIVFLYCGKPEQQIMYMLRVEKTDVPEQEWIDDRAYCIPPKQEINEDHHRVVRFRLLKTNHSARLTLQDLHGHGLGRLSQWASDNYPEELFHYIRSVFDEVQDANSDFEELDNPDEIYEGAKMSIVVNRYERDRRGRELCIKAYGCRCAVCNLDFEEVYGEIGRGFIHVHHVVPISEIGEEYRLDPENDLVPVCPNCHAMLHHGGNGRVLTVDELREIVGIRKRLFINK